ncbi:sensor histidine kinase [Leptolyngbya sp. FACHB-711]|uniref:sensor histidine kinase n=1 Tax=unclassified Leptolyngbya TaxID=2650499 RepID=UPI00168604ED|nr:sensor histidine kinase [Leptolyngbya sp. FACHB-711]MBD2025292.1 sensor histidine kinase [Leptolyngbya sp. FACHB-711]
MRSSLRRTLLKPLASLSKRVPLRAILIIPFLLQIVAIVGVTGYLSYRNGQDAVRDLVSQLEREASDRTRQTLETYLRIPQIVTEMNADNVRLGLLDFENISSLEPYLWEQFQQFSNQPFNPTSSSDQRCFKPTTAQPSGLTFIALATETGSYIDIGYNIDNQLELSIRDIRRDGILRVWSLNQWGRRIKLTQTVPTYDPRRRPWYQSAVQAGSLVWVDPYYTVTDNAPVISADRPFSDRQGNLLGVADATLSLAGIGQFLCDLKVGSTGQIFILEPDGDLIATSTGEKPFRLEEQEKKLINVRDSQNSLTRATASFLQRSYGNLSNISRSQEFEFHENGKRRFVKVQPFPGIDRRSGFRGLDWLVVVVIPEEEFMAKINANTRITILLCLIALLVAIALGIATSRWIARPILEMSRAAEALAEGDWDREVQIQRSGELGTLAGAFNHMRHQLKQSHQQLAEYSQGLEQKNKQLETLEAELRRQLNLFLHAVSHDLRNPVLGTAMVLNNLSEQSGDDLKVPRKILTRMQESNQRQLELINSLIDSHAAEIWGIALHPEPIALCDLVHSATSDLQPMFEKERTSLIDRIPTDLPLIKADPLQLARVYQNLMANALKHNPPGLTITLTAEPRDEWIFCTVSDNGIGIKSEQRDRLFDPYYRGSKKPKSVGLGLGLYLCHQIIEAHGGAIGVESEPGQGTLFWFTLPVA